MTRIEAMKIIALRYDNANTARSGDAAAFHAAIAEGRALDAEHALLEMARTGVACVAPVWDDAAARVARRLVDAVRAELDLS